MAFHFAQSFYFHFPHLKKGLEETESGVWKLLMAVAVHSSAVAFCIGAELVAKGGGLEIITHGLKRILAF